MRVLRAVSFLLSGSAFSQTSDYVGPKACQNMPSSRVQSMDEDAHGKRDPRSKGASRRHPARLFKRPNDLVNFTINDIAFVYGSVWKQRYLPSPGTAIFRSARSGTSPTQFGGPTTSRPAPVGGPSSIQATISSDPPVRRPESPCVRVEWGFDLYVRIIHGCLRPSWQHPPPYMPPSSKERRRPHTSAACRVSRLPEQSMAAHGRRCAGRTAS